MARVWYIGDAATAAGYRLAGAEVRVPAEGEAEELLRRAREAGAELIMVSAALLDELPRATLGEALLGEAPLVAVVPDAHGRHAPPDVAREVRLALGIEP